MEILDSFAVDDKNKIYAVSLEAGFIVDVKVCVETGLVYVMQNEDGSTVYGQAFTDYTFPDYSYDEEAVIQFIKESLSVSLDELLKDAAAIEYKGIIFDDWNLDKANGSVWAEMCAGCAEKYKDIISNELDDGDAIGVCSVSGCEISGLESENKHYYIDFKPELIHPVTKDQLLQMKTSSPERKVSLDQQMIAASAKAGQTLGRGRKSGPDIPEGR